MLVPFVAAAVIASSSANASSDAAGAINLEPVKVEASWVSPAKRARKMTPGAVSVIDADRFYRRHVGNVADAMRYVPGVWAQSASGGDGQFISIRGSNLDATDYDNNGVLLLKDGLPVTTADGNNHNRFVDPMSAREVTVARGANALAWGASTLGGAINFVSRTALDSNPWQAFLRAGSAGFRRASASAGFAGKRADALATVDIKHRDGYREHSREQHRRLDANAGWQVADGFALRFYASHIETDLELPGALTRDEFHADPDQANVAARRGNHQRNVTSNRLAVTGHWSIDDASSLDFGLSREAQSLYHPIVDVFVDTDGAGPKPPIDVFSLLIDTDQRTSGASLRYHATRGAHDWLAGVNLARTTVAGGNYTNLAGARGRLKDIVDKRALTTTVFVLDRWRFAPDWTLVYGAQGVTSDRRDDNIAGAGDGNDTPRNQRDRYSALNPRLGLIRNVGSHSEAYASVSRLYEAPDTFDLDNARNERGADATLKAMHGTAWEAGLRGHAGADESRWHWDVSAYYTRMQDEILSTDDPDHPGISLTANVPHTVHAGLEAVLGASLPLAEGVRLDPLLSASWNAFSFADDPVYGANRLPNAPRYALRGEFMLRSGNGLFAGPTFDLVGPRFADFANSYRLGAYALLGLRAGIRQPHWELFGEIRNLADRAYVATLSVRDHAAADAAILQPGAPRSVYVGFRLHF